jgi:hypothetical protein
VSAAVRTAPLVTEEYLERVAADPDWTAKVLCAAASALNTLLSRPQPGGFIRPGAEHFGATEVLMHAFTDWGAVMAALNVER